MVNYSLEIPGKLPFGLLLVPFDVGNMAIKPMMVALKAAPTNIKTAAINRPAIVTESQLSAPSPHRNCTKRPPSDIRGGSDISAQFVHFTPDFHSPSIRCHPYVPLGT